MLKKICLSSRRITKNKRIERLAIVFVGMFIITAIQRFWIHPSGGHSHRQSDTIGMTIAFAEQFRDRGFAALDFLIYPRILQRGFLDGINASEFPLLNVMGGFSFLMGGTNPWKGVFLTSLMILFLNLYVAYTCLPKLLAAWKVNLSGTVCLLLWFAGGTLAGQSIVIMPEGIAFPLVLAGVVQILESKNKWGRFTFGILLCNFGIASKPTVLLIIGALAVLPLIDIEQRREWKRLAIGCVLSVVFPAWWYTTHVKYILSFAQGPQIFALADFNSIRKLRELGLEGLLSLIRREPYQGQLPMFVGWYFIIAAVFLGEWIPAILYLLSLVAATSLDGKHIFVHGYYFIGTCIFSLILMARVLGAVDTRRYLKILTIAFLAWGVLFNIRGNVWIWARDSQYWKVSYWNMGIEARKIIDQNYHLITDDGAYPQKLLFIGRSGTAANGGAYQACKKEQYSKHHLAIITDAPPPKEVLCNGRSQELKTIETSFTKWYVTLVR